MKKILFLMESLECGGAERVLVNLVNRMNRQKYNITVATLFEDGVFCETLNPSVHYLSMKRRKIPGMTKIMWLLPKKMLFRHYFKTCDYDLIIAYMTGIPTLIAAGAPVKKIAWVHSVYYPVGKLNPKHYFLSKTYKRYDAIAGVSKEVCRSFKTYIKTEHQPVVVLNTNDTEQIKRLADSGDLSHKDEIEMVTTGCLEPTKGYDRLIEACGQLVKEGYCFHLSILGEGAGREKLEQLIKILDLNEQVSLLGYQKNPYSYVKNADIFVCSSRIEGLSTAVTEAIILGKPVISTDVSGAKEILGDNNECGLVVENSEAGIYTGIKQFLDDPNLRAYYAAKADERTDFFSTERTVKQAENLIEKVMES